VFRDHLVEALESVWQELDIKRTSDWAREGGFIGVGEENAEIVEPLWTDAQLGLTDVVEGLKSGQGALGVLENVLAREQQEIKQGLQAVAAAA
jgi:5-aminolevulinate synthase